MLLATAQPKEAVAATNSPVPAIILEDFKLTGDLHGNEATFNLTANARLMLGGKAV